MECMDCGIDCPDAGPVLDCYNVLRGYLCEACNDDREQRRIEDYYVG